MPDNHPPDSVDRASPNFGPRRGDGRPVLVVLHYTAMETEGALDRLCDPAAEVSAHHLIDADGRRFGLVDERERAHLASLPVADRVAYVALMREAQRLAAVPTSDGSAS